jgi:hypothetical protein
MAGSISDWDLLYKRIKSNLRPGGWVETQEFEVEIFSQNDPAMSKSPNIAKWIGILVEASKKFQKRLDIAKEQKQKMIQAGFINVQEEVYQVCYTLLDIFISKIIERICFSYLVYLI